MTYKWKSSYDKYATLSWVLIPRLKVTSRKILVPPRWFSIMQHAIMGWLYLSISLSQSVLGPYTLAVARALESGTRSKASRQWSIYYVCGMYLLSAIPRRAVCTPRTFTLEPTVAGERASLTAEFVKCGENNYNQPRQSQCAPLLPVACKYDYFDERAQWRTQKPKPWWKYVSEDEMLHLQSD